MSIVGSAYHNQYLTMQYACINGITTTGITPVVAYSIAVPQNKLYRITVDVHSYKSDFSQSNTGQVQGSFIRGTGNVAKDGSLIKNLIGALSTTIVDLVANTSTQSVDITLTPILGTIVWNLGINIISNT